MKAQADSNSRGQKDFIVEKRRESFMGACRGTQKLMVPWIRLEIGYL
jgi:hypothetical protein